MQISGQAAPARVGVLGGTFDPIHIGHLVAASEALAAFQLDRVIFVPAGRPWQKDCSAAAEDRFMMTALAAASSRRFAVSRIELDRPGPTYTVDTMEVLRDLYGPGTTLHFIAGADAASHLGSWTRVERLAELMELVVASRPGFDASELLPVPNGWPPTHVMEMPAIGISSSDIRTRVRNGRPIDYLVPGEVVSYIARQGLYMGDD